MGSKIRKSGAAKAFRKRRDDEYEWEYERSRLFASTSDDELRKLVRVALVPSRRSIDGHAYSKEEVEKLRHFLKAKSSEWSDDLLHRHLDEFAVFVGLAVRSERQKPTRDRINELTGRLLEIAKDLDTSIADRDVAREFLQPWGGYREFDIDSFKKHLAEFIRCSERHLDALKRRGTKGKPWNSDLKVFFIDTVSILCEYIDNDFEPRRGLKSSSSQLNDVANLLGPALFEPDSQQGTAHFDGAIRDLVDRWNYNKRKLMKRARSAD